ncbi:hypothetical protein MUO74_07865 [Candidatus Bathyarchaeota archaeon]|nr:hypothetical protein [Candidatus Bathyarchaeota archaeon]
MAHVEHRFSDQVSNADINDKGIVDVFDIAVVATIFGETGLALLKVYQYRQHDCYLLSRCLQFLLGLKLNMASG